jgi:hypothetical protein
MKDQAEGRAIKGWIDVIEGGAVVKQGTCWRER